jgi:hypothetical protein
MLWFDDFFTIGELQHPWPLNETRRFFIIIAIALGLMLQLRVQRSLYWAKFNTTNEIKVILHAIQAYEIDKRAFPPGFPTNATMIYETLAKKSRPYLPANPRWDSTGSIVDRWNVPYNFRVITSKVSRTPTYNLEVWSAGHNKKDELGKGDDILVREELIFWERDLKRKGSAMKTSWPAAKSDFSPQSGAYSLVCSSLARESS